MKFSKKIVALCVLASVSCFASAQALVDEAFDWGVKPERALRFPTSENKLSYHANTPTTIPGAKTISTKDLVSMMNGPNKPVIIYVGTSKSDGDVIDLIPGTHWLFTLGLGAPEYNIYNTALVKLLAGKVDASRPIVTYCTGPRCWLSYNTALRLAGAGFKNVYWYRGGRDVWMGQLTALPLQKTSPKAGLAWAGSPGPAK